ncbi:MAG TPA: hypothetical protein VFQ37_15015 [Mycobacterium sp.]|nr:hypothetical protein [Mycobacterium sp.]
MNVMTDDELNGLLLAAQPYSVVIMKSGPNYTDKKALTLSWEHNRLNFALQDCGVVTTYLRVMDDSDVYGVAVFDATVGDTITLMEGDPAVATGVFAYEVHPCRGFLGNSRR